MVRSDYIPRIQEVQASMYHVLRETLETLAPCLSTNFSEPPVVPTRARCANGSNGKATNSPNTTSKPTPSARERMMDVSGGQRSVPVLVEDGKIGPDRLAGQGLRRLTMHELSIAMSIVEMAEEECRRRRQRRAVHLKLGALSGVVKSALLSSFELACEGTALAGSSLVIEEIPVIVYCAQCRANRSLDPERWFVCPECGTSPCPKCSREKNCRWSALELCRVEATT